MIYFSYNDFSDCSENGKIDEIKKLEENVIKYERKNSTKYTYTKENVIIKILKEKIELIKFLREFFNFHEIGDIKSIRYCNTIKSISDKGNHNIITCKIENKEMFILIKVIKDIDTNISYKMFEHSINIINKWKNEENENKRYPIVIPIIIYVGDKEWKNKNKTYQKINYTTCEDNKINFSYNLIDINNLNIQNLENMESKIAKEIINIKII